jgi:hypothetical protein
LDAATDCLRSFAAAYVNFSASALAVTPVEVEAGNTPNSPPDDFDTMTSMVEAWVYAGLTPAVQSLPLEQLRALLRQFGQSAAASSEVTAVLRYQLALLRAKQAVADGALEGSADAQQDLDEALAEAEAAARSRAREPDAIRNLDDMREAGRCWSRSSRSGSSSGLPGMTC